MRSVSQETLPTVITQIASNSFLRGVNVRRDWRFEELGALQKLKSAFTRFWSFGETDFAWLCSRVNGSGQGPEPRRSSAKPSEVWLGGRDSNPDNVVQSHVSYR